jgi:glycerophosphoryl diester phosphodiesterase
MALSRLPHAIPVAHRGLHGAGIPENSLAAFTVACDAGVGIELDVHPVEDAVAVFHDVSLQRMCGVSGTLAGQTRASLRDLRLAGTDEHVPVLDEVLDLVGGAVPLAIELKPPAAKPAGELLCRRVAQLLTGYAGSAVVMSFDPELLRWFARHLPAVGRVQLSASRRVPEVAAAILELGIPRWKALAMEHLAIGLISRPYAIGYDVRALPHPAVRLARRLGRSILAGIVTDLDELETAMRYGDGVFFEHLDPQEVVGRWRDRAH